MYHELYNCSYEFDTEAELKAFCAGVGVAACTAVVTSKNVDRWAEGKSKSVVQSVRRVFEDHANGVMK
jgi:predicted small secreted protein